MLTLEQLARRLRAQGIQNGWSSDVGWYDLTDLRRQKWLDMAQLVMDIQREELEQRVGQAPRCARPLDRDVRDAHRKMVSVVGSRPALPPVETVALRRRLICDEFAELVHELDQDVPQVRYLAQEAVDLVYTTIGLMVELGVDLQPIWDLVHAANMRKVGDGTGKWAKPEGWVSPRQDIAEEILRQREMPR